MSTIEAKGINGQITVEGDWLTIHRKGLLAKGTQGMKGDKRIPLSSVTAVQFKKAGLTNGYLQLSIGGGSESGGGVRDAVTDENTVMFTGRHAKDFEAVRDYIEAHIQQRMSAAHGPVPAAAPLSVADELTKLASLRDSGVLSAEEFDEQKRRLLGG